MKKLVIFIILAITTLVLTSFAYAENLPIDKACTKNKEVVSLDSIPTILSCSKMSSILIDGKSVDIEKVLSNKEFIVNKKILKSIGYDLVLDLKTEKVYAVKGKNKIDVTSFVKSFVLKLK